MDRIQEIEKQFEFLKDTYIFQEYVELVEMVEYLLAENKKYKEALINISDYADKANCHWCGNGYKDLAQQALKEEESDIVKKQREVNESNPPIGKLINKVLKED